MKIGGLDGWTVQAVFGSPGWLQAAKKTPLG